MLVVLGPLVLLLQLPAKYHKVSLHSMDDADDDTHLCLRCRSTITGLQQYIIHRKGHCSANKQVEPEPQIITRSPVHHYEPSPLRADDFFSSLELQSIQVTVTGNNAAAKSVQADDDFDEADDSDSDLYPPRTHTGGKWKPGWRPDSSTWKSIQSPTKQFQDLPGKSEGSDFYCMPCDRRYRDKYSFIRHISTWYHIKRSGGKLSPCKKSSRNKSSKFTDIIDGLLAKDTRKGSDERTRTRRNSKPSLPYSAEPEVRQRAETDEFPTYAYRSENRPLYIQCLDPTEVIGPTHCSADIGEKQNHRETMSESALSEGTNVQRNGEMQKERFSPRDISPIKLDMNNLPPSPSDELKATPKSTKAKAEVTKTSCPYCSKVVNKLYMKFHLFTHTGEQPFQCHLCGRTFAHRSTLSTHIKHHLGLKRYACSQCPFRAVRPSMLRRHQKSIHSTGVCARTLYCHVCGLAHYNQQSLRQHILRHNLDSLHNCCDTTYGDEQALLCDTCGFSTANMHQLIRHKRKHTGERPFKCELCNFSSSRSGPLQRHLRIHTGAKPYKCPHCDYACSSQENVRKHILKTKKHAGKKMYICSECAFDTNQFSAFKDHLQSEHGHQRTQLSSAVSLTVGRSPENKVEETISGMQGDVNIAKGMETVTEASIATSEVPLSQATSFEIMSRESCNLEITSQSDLQEFRTTELGVVDGYLPLTSPVHQIPSIAKDPSSVDHTENRRELSACLTSSPQKMPLKNPYLLEPSREPPVFYVSSSDFSGLGSSLETATLDSFLPVRSPLLKTYRPNITNTPVENSVSIEPVDPANCVLLPELHEQLGVQATDTVGVTQLDGNNAVYICMPLNGP
ncbi:zinc finger and BTB domain-containing protein 24-like [Ornithodoros turicata]